MSDKEKILHQISVSDLPEKQPTVSLHLIVKNAEPVIARTLTHVLPYLSQIRIVLNDTDDSTESVIGQTLAGSHVMYDIQHVRAASHPEFYILDVPETYEMAGPSLSGEEFNGPCTGRSLLCDWSGARNLGWPSGCDFRLQLDADDMLVLPESLPLALKAMQAVGADLAASPYHISNTTKTVYRERVARSTPLIKWEGRVHDQLVGGLRRLLLEDLLVTVDRRDNKGSGTRVFGRDFKTLYYLARKQEWKVSLRHYLYLIQEARTMMPFGWVAGALFERYRQEFDAYGTPARLPEKARVYTMIGEMFEEHSEVKEASRWYERATTAHPTKSGYWKLCKVLHLLGLFEQCIASWEASLKCAETVSVLDLQPVSELGTQVVVADSLRAVGRKLEALQMIDFVFGLCPVPGVAKLKDQIATSLDGFGKTPERDPFGLD